MLVNDETIEKLESLSMLEVSDKEGMKQKLEEVLSFMENLKGVEDIEVSEDTKTNYREDKPQKKVDLEVFFRTSDKVVNHSFEVPKIL